VFLLAPISWLIAVILYYVLRKQGQLSLPICYGCDARWKKANLAVGLSALGLVLGLVLGGVATGAADEPALFFIFLVLSIGEDRRPGDMLLGVDPDAAREIIQGASHY
jgi:hypothetical protein